MVLSLPSPQASTTNLLSIAMGLPTLYISYKWNHIIDSLGDLPLSRSLMLSRLFHVVACIRTSSHFMAKQQSIIGIHHILFIHSFIGRALKLFPPFAKRELGCYQDLYTGFCLTPAFSSSRYTFGIEPRVAGLYDNTMFNLLRNC